MYLDLRVVGGGIVETSEELGAVMCRVFYVRSVDGWESRREDCGWVWRGGVVGVERKGV